MFDSLAKKRILNKDKGVNKVVGNLRQRCEVQLILYLSPEGINLLDGDGQYNNPLGWWKENTGRFDLVAAVAHAFLSMPATSAPSERAWSRSANVLILTAKRNRLNSELASGIVFVRENIKILDKHYDAVTLGGTSALPRELAGIPVMLGNDDDEEFDAGQDDVLEAFA